MKTNVFSRFVGLDLEERIINIAASVAAVSVFLPWTSGYMLGSDPLTYSGLGFYTSFIGTSVLLLNVFIVLITLVPITGGPVIVRKNNREIVRLICSLASTILILAALSVLMKVTFQFSRMEIRFGINIVLIASMAVTLYAFLKVQQQKRGEVENIFQNPAKEERNISKSSIAFDKPKPPEPEDHHFHGSIHE